jgi:hypothetical protein
MRSRQVRRSGRRIACALASLLLLTAVLCAGSASAASAARATASGSPPTGYVLAANDGGVFAFGRPFRGSAAGLALRGGIVGIAATPTGNGYWLAGRDGGVFAFGDARFYGSLGGVRLNAGITSIAATSDGRGYWLVGQDGGVFAFGDAAYVGSVAGSFMPVTVVGIAPTATNRGYWELTDMGGVFGYGDALTPGAPLELHTPFVGGAGIAHVPGTSRGIVVTSWDGERAVFYADGSGCSSSSSAALPFNEPMVGIALTRAGCGEWLTASDGGVFTFGAPFYGSTGALRLVRPIVGIAS